jgi:hypothetical protein
MPFADYADFDECVAKNGDKDDPAAYCATIERKTKGLSVCEAHEFAGCQDESCRPPPAGGTGGSKPSAPRMKRTGSNTTGDLAETRSRFGQGRRLKRSSEVVKVAAEVKSAAVDNFVEEDFIDDERVGHRDINAHLRGQEIDVPEDAVQAEVEALTSLIDKAPRVSEDVIAYRGIGFRMDGIEPGALITDRGFMSVSVMPSIADEFAEMGPDMNGDIIEIMVPMGTKGVVGVREESEIIIQRGSSLRVIEVVEAVPSKRFATHRTIKAVLEQT